MSNITSFLISKVDKSEHMFEGAKAFYTELFGWSAIDNPAGPDMVYTMLQIEGKDVAGLYQMSEEQRSQGMPPHWLSYVSVANVDERAAKAKSLGGQVLQEPFDVMDVGRMALVQDPTGAVLALWQPRAHIGARLANVPGARSWNELATNDTQVAGEFYTRLFDWGTQVQEMGPTTYTTFMNGERMNGGMLQITEEWGDVPPHWMVYFTVEDCDGSAEKAKELGGEIIVPPRDIPPVGRFAVVQDPQGAAFTIIRLNNSE
jgi:predicted enzyme related to lactoylglutathione lyase